MSGSVCRAARLAGAAAIAGVMCACSPENNEEAEAERTAILRQVPLGTPFEDAAAALQAIGFSCSPGRGQSSRARDPAGTTREHLWCEREQSHWLVCRRRAQALALPLHGRLSEMYVNVQVECF